MARPPGETSLEIESLGGQRRGGAGPPAAQLLGLGLGLPEGAADGFA
jgi:hypothetical protein